MDEQQKLNELAKAAQAGSEDAYRDLAKHLHGNFLSIAKRLGKSSDCLIDDLHNEAIFSLMKSIPAWNPAKSPLIPWVCECAKRAMYSHMRTIKRDIDHNMSNAGQDIELTCDENSYEAMVYDSEDGAYDFIDSPEHAITWDDMSEVSVTSCAAVEAIHQLDKSQREMVLMILNGAKLDDVAHWLIENGMMKRETPERLYKNEVRMRMRRCLEMVADYIRDIDPALAKQVSITTPTPGPETGHLKLDNLHP